MAKTVAITGAGGALAAAVIDLFKAEGWHLALLVHSDSEKVRLEQTYPEAIVVRVDLGTEAQANEAIQTVQSQSGAIDVLLNIAGGFSLNKAVETSAEDLNKQLTINLWTVFNATRAVLDGMLEHGSGFILGVGAAAALNGGSKMGPYAASKAAMSAYLKSVAAELEGKGIGVGVLYPMGAIDTPGNRKAMPDADPESWINARELAETILLMVTRSKRGRVREVKIYPPA